MKEVRVGIAGTGAMGHAHARAYTRNGAPIVAVADTDAARAEPLAADHGAKAVTSVEDLLAAGATAVSICLPHHLHVSAVLLCARRRVPVLIEKPHCCTAEEARMIREVCREYQQTPMVGFTHRFLRSTLELERRLRAGELGSIDLVTDCLAANSLGPNTPSWFGDRQMAGGGIAMIGAIHSIDRFRWLLASEVVAVNAVCRAAEAEGVEHLAVITLEFACGAVGSLTAYRSPAPGHARHHRYQLFGTRGEAGSAVDEFACQRMGILVEGQSIQVDCAGDDPFAREISEFLASIRQARPPQPGLDDGELALAVVLAIYESARTGQRVLMENFMQQHFSFRQEAQ